MNENKEKRGIYNVSFNEKNSTPINTELELIENAVIDYVIHYIKGWHNTKRDKGRGAEHIKLHLEENSQGQITIEELLNLGNYVRKYLKEFKEPFIENENKDGRVYEWENEKGIRFRIATDKIKGEGLIPPLSPSDEIIITFYSDRNLKERMLFKNPKVALFYESKELNKQLENLLKQRNKNKEINILLKEMKNKNIKLNKENQTKLKNLNQLSR
ncbi:hypothetical protein [uncultured Campylobacter sp.]|uniref:hypothetical protein n=1 Tax=uncultured Campylobacter sp. TaxID=218934 RepID=UPI0026264D17|nr:hypothetical protein [uncultured Campylobacter sp.]